mgnify:CR=1 FL=1
MKDELRSLSLAILLSFIAIYSVNYFFGIDKKSAVQRQISEIEQAAEQFKHPAAEKISPAAIKTTEDAVAEDLRIKFENNSVAGSIRLKGARFDDLYLTKYNVSLEENSPKVELLKPAQTANQYFADLGWLSLDKNLALPTANTIWKTQDTVLTPDKPVVLNWENGQGLMFIRKISMDKDYLFTVDDTVINNTKEEIELFPYALISRNIKDMVQTRSVVHEGMNGVINNTLHELKYKDLDSDDSESFETSGGWLGFSDRYWFSALILGNQDKAKVTFKNNGDYNYQADFLGSRVILPAGGETSYSYRLFSGAKEVKLLDKYTKENHIPKFDLAVDFGWYYFLTKPFFYILDFLYGFLVGRIATNSPDRICRIEYYASRLHNFAGFLNIFRHCFLNNVTNVQIIRGLGKRFGLFSNSFQESPLPESAILLPPNRQNASFYYVKNITRYINS